jgi:predicted DCC family thiol-disulfide oxidoreductase YuxK
MKIGKQIMETGSNLEQSQSPLIVFDGYCVLCSNAVQFIFRRDINSRFKYVTLKQIGKLNGINEQIGNQPGNDSVILIENGQVYYKSNAALRITRRLNCGWPLLYAFIIVPRFLRDAIYDFIARNRYKWFGKKDTCFIPSPEQKKYFPGQFE